jgi:hypothetical protein
MNFRKLFIKIVGALLVVVTISSISYFVGKHPDKSSNILYGIPHKTVELLVSPVKITRRLFLYKDSNYIKNDSLPDGVKYYGANTKPFDSLYLLYSYKSPKNETIQLIDLTDGSIVKEWLPDMNKITALAAKDNPFFPKDIKINSLGHPIMLKDSSIIAGTWYCTVKINSDSSIAWVKNDYQTHHSIEQDHEGNLWLSSRRHITKINNLLKDSLSLLEQSKFMDDVIMKIEPENGAVLFEKSVIELLKDNQLDYLITRNGNFEMDPIHLNDVQPALADGDYWKKGDVFISSRHLSAIFLYRPSTNKVLWHKQGPWLNQHDPNILDSHSISILDNQMYRTSPRNISKYIKAPLPYNAVYIYDFSNDSITEPYQKLLKSESVNTPTNGRATILPNGDLFFEETTKGRIIIGDSINKKMTFAKRISDKEIAVMRWSRIIKN